MICVKATLQVRGTMHLWYGAYMASIQKIPHTCLNALGLSSGLIFFPMYCLHALHASAHVGLLLVFPFPAVVRTRSFRLPENFEDE